MKKSIKNRNKTKSTKRRKPHTKRKYKFRGSGTGSSKAMSPIDEVNHIDREKQTMNVKQKLEAILKLAPEELVATKTAFGKEPKDMSISELKNNLAFLGVDTSTFIERIEFQNSLSSKYTEMNNVNVDQLLDVAIKKRRAKLMRELRENEEKQRLINLETQRKQEEQRQRMQEEQRRKEQEKQRKNAQSKMNEMQKYFNQIIEMDIDSDVQSHEESQQYSPNQSMYSRNYGYPPPPPPLPPFRPATYQIDYENGIIYKTTWNGIKTPIHTKYTKY